MLWHLSDTTCYVCYFHLLQVRAKSLSKHSTKMSLLFRQLVARAGRPPTDPYSDLELYSFWVGNILPTSTRDRQEMLQARSTRQRMIILLRLMMETIEQLIDRVCQAVHGQSTAALEGNTINFAPPYRRLTMRDAIMEHAGVDIDGLDEAGLRQACSDLGIEADPSMGKGKLIDEIFGEKCEHHLVQPTFITDYPVEMSPLTKAHRDKPGYTERFELFINGTEVANAYSELNDPIDQRERFEDQLKLGARGDDEAMFIDQDFLRALEYGMPPTSGVGIGVDRLVMMLTNQRSIQEVLFFPQMRPEVFRSGPDLSALEAMGIPADWAPHVAAAGFDTPDAIKDAKPAALREKLNGFRKKNKLDLPALQLEEVSAWTGA